MGREGGDRVLGVFTQSWGKRVDPLGEVLTFLGPTELDDLVVFRVEHSGKIARDVVVEIEPGLGIGAPGVFGFEKKFPEKSNVGGAAGLEFALRDPGAAEARDFSIAGNFDGIAGDPVDPGVADFLRDSRKILAKGLNCVGDVGEAAGVDLPMGELAGQVGVNVRDLGRRVRTWLSSATTMATARSEPGTCTTLP